jgi:hypothetical protein
VKRLFVLTPEARNDLKEILLDIAEDSPALHPWSDLPGCHAGVLAGVPRRMPVGIPAWQAGRPLHGAPGAAKMSPAKAELFLRRDQLPYRR